MIIWVEGAESMVSDPDLGAENIEKYIMQFIRATEFHITTTSSLFQPIRKHSYENILIFQAI